MHIGLNAQLLSLSQSYRGAGISWYIINLLRNLGAVSPADFRYTAFLHDRNFAAPTEAMQLRFSRLPTQRPMVRIFWEQVVQPLAVRQAGVDLLHALAFVAPALSPAPMVVTVYDLSFIRYPQAFRPFQRWYLSHFTRRTVSRAKAIITISESTRQDVIHFLSAPPERVHTIYCGSEASFRPLPPAEVAAFKSQYQLPDKFILFLGTLEPRKNIEGLIRAYAHWKQVEPTAPPLVIAGGKGWYYHHIFELVETLKLTGAIHFPGYVPQETLPMWYNAATVFVYPSRFEGFGLPVLEAMACGTPVITSTASSLPEVTGTEGAAWLVDPDNTTGLAEAMAAVSGQPARQAEMSALGLARAAQFSWQKTARQTVAVYQKVLGS
jgi:glycosyltransferase involved in cell wall biosynthesis